MDKQGIGTCKAWHLLAQAEGQPWPPGGPATWRHFRHRKYLELIGFDAPWPYGMLAQASQDNFQWIQLKTCTCQQLGNIKMTFRPFPTRGLVTLSLFTSIWPSVVFLGG